MYVEHPPAPALRPYVECFWTRVTLPSAAPPGGAPHGYRVLPDGCIDIVLGFGGGRDAALAVGTMTRPLVVVDAREHPTLLGVRFRPGKATAFLGVPASALTDLRVPLADVCRGVAALLDESAASPPVLARVAAVERALLRRLAAAPPAPAPEVDAAVRAILAARGTLSIAALASALGVSRQHLARRFNAHVGVPPKMFARVARVRHLLRQVRRARRADWSALAYEMGYADQPHLITEVKAITGLTPRQWAAERGFAG